jgi:hypothetical protein
MQTSFLTYALPLSLILSSVAACSGSSNDSDPDDWAESGNGGSGGSGGAGGSTGGTGGSTGGTGGTGGSGASTSQELGTGVMAGVGSSSERYYTANVQRDGIPYFLITNGWGPGFQSHTISWDGTAFVVERMAGTQGPNYQPASYPSVFCGKYSVMQVPACGLPAAITSLPAVKTGWRWTANGNTGSYNAAYDIWLGDGTNLQSYLMVWLRDPPGAQPAGSRGAANVSVANVPGVWQIWSGTVNGLPIVNYAKLEGTDIPELEFDVLDFVRDARTRSLNLPGTHVNAVAIGFEIWSGPVSNLRTDDFYVHVN